MKSVECLGHVGTSRSEIGRMQVVGCQVKRSSLCLYCNFQSILKVNQLPILPLQDEHALLSRISVR